MIKKLKQTLFALLLVCLPFVSPHAAVKKGRVYPQPALTLKNVTLPKSPASAAEITKIKSAALSDYADTYLREFCELRDIDECIDFTANERTRLEQLISKNSSIDFSVDGDSLKKSFKEAMDNAAKAFESTINYRNLEKLNRLSGAVKNMEQKLQKYEGQLAQKERNPADEKEMLAGYVQEKRLTQFIYIIVFCLGIISVGVVYCLFKIVN